MNRLLLLKCDPLHLPPPKRPANSSSSVSSFSLFVPSSGKCVSLLSSGLVSSAFWSVGAGCDSTVAVAVEAALLSTVLFVSSICCVFEISSLPNR